jgi:hypothetical protein
VTAAGGKLVAMYGTMIGGPGAMVIVDVDASIALAITAVVASSDGVHNVRAQRLFTMDEVMAIRQKRVQLQASYRPPGLSGNNRERICGRKPMHRPLRAIIDRG